jgi:hypothetical protein
MNIPDDTMNIHGNLHKSMYRYLESTNLNTIPRTPMKSQWKSMDVYTPNEHTMTVDEHHKEFMKANKNTLEVIENQW